VAAPAVDPAGHPPALREPPPAALAPIPLPPPSPPPAVAGAAAGEPPLPGLGSLSAQERATLPPLKLSMHVWSAEPARRFAIVDGQRVTEGGLLGGGTVAEIRRDGVVVALGDRRLLLPRP
jgi:general secretion pathway protein B